ncbi:MAG: UvrB/UvrC motif-containing protein [Candidatus Krumholzibacteria bacterium]|nr:UvrB/UvrC motif-containing protein [Candidatus Krumholzibacteria bacterium]
MLCQVCKKREATIHFTNVVGKNVEKIHLCSHCAGEKGFDYLKKSNFAMEDLLAGLLGAAAKAAESKKGRNRCPNCGTSYVSFKKAGKLGCSQCYDFFEAQLVPILRSIHGDTRHLGKVPGRFREKVSFKRRISELQDELNRAVEIERYEKAAELRDEIKRIKESRVEGKQCQD